MILYHWTPRRSMASIWREGLQPDYATGMQPVIWLANRNRSFGLLDCASKVHQIPTRGFCLIRVTIDVKGLQKWRLPGVYRSTLMIPVDCLQWVSPEVLWDCRPHHIVRSPVV